MFCKWQPPLNIADAQDTTYVWPFLIYTVAAAYKSACMNVNILHFNKIWIFSCVIWTRVICLFTTATSVLLLVKVLSSSPFQTNFLSWVAYTDWRASFTIKQFRLWPVDVPLAPLPLGVQLPRTHTQTHINTHARVSNPDGWLHRSAWVSFMIPGSPTSLTRHHPVTQENTVPSLTLPPPPLSLFCTYSYNAVSPCSCNTPRDHRETTAAPGLQTLATPSLLSSFNTDSHLERTPAGDQLCPLQLARKKRNLRLHWGRLEDKRKHLLFSNLSWDVGQPSLFVPQCPRCCHTTRGKWAATGRTARSARCPLAADCRTQAPFSLRRRRKDPQSSDRSAEPSEVKDG